MNYNDYKILTKKEALKLFPPWFKWKTKPWTNQAVALACALHEDGFLCAMDLGTGKTKVGIDYCRFFQHRSEDLKVLVVCLNSAVENWADEVKIHSDMRSVCIRAYSTKEKSSKDLKFEMLDGGGFFITSFESLLYWVTKKEKAGDKSRRDIDRKLLDRLLSFDFDVMIIDESHKIKNHRSLIFRIIKAMSKSISKRLLMTGTPFNTLIDIWTQYYLVDFGDTFFQNITKFRESYFENKGWFGPKWVVTKTGEKRIREKLFSKAIRYEESEVGELPDKVYRILEYPLSVEQREVYDNLLEKIPDGRVKDVVNRTMAFKQICSGFIIKTNYTFGKNPKIEFLRDLVEQVVDAHKIVVFHEFTLEGILIQKMLKKMKVKFNLLNGSVKDKHKEYKTFQDDDSYRVMIAHPKSGGASINLVAATYCLFFSNGGSVISRKQAEKRIHRGGQKSRCFFYDFTGKKTVETSQLKMLRSGIDMFDNTMDGDKFRSFLRGE